MMRFQDYLKTIEDVPVSDKLKYALAVLWLHPGHLPLGLVSIGDETMTVIKVPERTVNQFGNEGIIVPVIAVGANAFRGRQNITDVVLPSSIETIGSHCFDGCTNLRNITIPKSVTAIKEGTFAGCTQLENIYYEGSPEEWAQIRIVHQKHEVEFGSSIPGTPVQQIVSERFVHIPGNEALFSANVNFHCQLSEICTPVFQIRAGGKDLTEHFKLM